jgi:PAS domain S-box-containing protein
MLRPHFSRSTRWRLVASALPLATLSAQAHEVGGGAAQSAPWIVPALGVLALGAPLVWWLNGRLRRQVGRHRQALDASETRLRSLFDHAPVAIVETDFSAVVAWLDELRRRCLIDLDAFLLAHPAVVAEQFKQVRVVDANRIVLRLSGVANVADYVASLRSEPTPEVLAAFVAQIKCLWAGESEMTRELNNRGIDGQPGHSLMHWSAPVVAGRPDYSRVQVAFTDLSGLRAAEGKLQDVEDRWRLAVMGINAGIWEFDFATKETFVSERWQEIIGYSSTEMINPGEDFWPRVHPDDAKEVKLKLQAYLAGTSSRYAVEFRMRCKDGSYKWIRSQAMALFELSGKPIRMVGSHTDIDERKRAEAALAAERERLAVTLRAMAEGVVTTDVQGRVLFLNEAACELTGWTATAAIGRLLEEVCVLRHEKSRQALPPLAEAAISTGQVADLPARTALFDRSATPRLVEGRCAPIHDLHNQAIGVVLVLRDVTERARLEGEILRASKLESVGVLAGGIAHDFNNLLTVVMGNITLAMLDVQVMAAAGRWLQNAEVGVMRARDLTQQLLTFARGGEPVRSAVNLPDVIKEAAHFALHGSKARCDFAIEEGLWTADVDKGQIGQVVQNLVINAVQAMPEGGVIQMTLSNQRLAPTTIAQLSAGEYVCITIQDTGEGIPAENLARIFEPYFTTKKSGNGLGLAMVYSIIRRHSGHIEVDSELGRGTRFRFWLPAVPGVAAVPHEVSPAPKTYTGRVLFMDDEEAIRLMVSALLERLGFQVVLAVDGREVISLYVEALAANARFDLVIMDLTVPGGMGGREAMLELRKLDPGVRGLVSSGYSSDPIMANFRAHGFNGMVAKPYRLTDLAKAIRAVIDDSQG